MLHKIEPGVEPVLLLCRASGAGKLNAAKALVQANAKLDLKDQTGMTPLALAASCGHDFCALWLASRGAAIEVCAWRLSPCLRLTADAVRL